MRLKSRGKKIFKKQPFFENLRRKITFSMEKTIKSLMFVVEKTYPVNNHIFKIDIENTRTQGEKYVSYLPFHCLDDFHCLHDLQKNWNLNLKLA